MKEKEKKIERDVEEAAAANAIKKYRIIYKYTIVYMQLFECDIPIYIN